MDSLLGFDVVAFRRQGGRRHLDGVWVFQQLTRATETSFRCPLVAGDLGTAASAGIEARGAALPGGGL
jgi:hypothetical protein